MTHEIEGGHHHISADLCRKAGLEEAICHAVEAHHDDVEATTPEALIVRVVDALSAARPGARGDTYENYVKRMTELENLADTFPGVAKTYAVWPAERFASLSHRKMLMTCRPLSWLVISPSKWRLPSSFRALLR